MTDNPMTNPAHKAKVLVTGATGMQGGAVVQALLRAGHPVTALVRNPASAPAQALAGQGVVLATGDLEDFGSLEAASVGHNAVFSVQLAGVDPADPGAEPRQAGNIVAAANSAGINQIVHTSVSSTGWRTRHPQVELPDNRLMTQYWDEKEQAEDVVRRSGLPRWTIVKPPFYMENFIPPRRAYMFPDMTQGKLVVASQPQTVLALICADDLGRAVATAVAEPDRFHEVEIELAGDALTYPKMAEILSQATGREIVTEFITLQDRAERYTAPAAFGDAWNDKVGYPARPDLDAAEYGLTSTTFAQWVARQDWITLPGRT